MVAIHSGVGQVIDVSLLESMSQLMGPLAAAFLTPGFVQERMGSGLPYSVPRGTYRCADGNWLALSASSASVSARVMGLLGLDDDRFASFDGRAEHRDEIEQALSAWIGARSLPEALDEFEQLDIAAAPVLDIEGLLEDPQAIHREVITRVDGVPMQNLVARLSATPGSIRWPGRPLDHDGDDIRDRGWQ